ncbi:MAG: DUF3866 family protein [Solirubrobacteraceae bacterium]
MLKLRRGTVVEADEGLLVEVGGDRRPAWADEHMVGPCKVGDEVVVNVEALDLALGSGGFDVVHVNLTRGLASGGPDDPRVMKLNYTSLQHAVAPVEERAHRRAAPGVAGVIFLHGQLAAVCWALAQRAPGARVGYVQTAGGALPGSLPDVVRELRERELLAGHVTAGAAHGGEAEAITTAGALDHGLGEARWDVALCGPGPGILGSGSRLGHGGMSALDSAHVAMALGHRTVLVPRMSAADRRQRHRGLSHHSRTVLELLLAPVVLALPEQERPPPEAERHEPCGAAADLDGYRASGLPARTMGRSLEEDPLFFASALAGGAVLADMIRRA